MVATGVNTIATSSCGRLFDAVSALLGVCLESTYEGQAAMQLEAIAAPNVDDHYPFQIEAGEIDFRPAVRALLAEGDAPLSSAKFHNTIAEAVTACCAANRGAALNRVCLSGGSFQNEILLCETTRRLREKGFEVYLHTRVPSNDGGLSLGQVMVANARIK